MYLFGRAKLLGMLGLGFGAGGPEQDGDKENRKTTSPQTSPWLKRQKVSPAVLPLSLSLASPQESSSGVLQGIVSSQNNNNQDNKHSQIVKSISEQLLKYRTVRALKTMRSLPNFEKDFLTFVREQSRLEADNILKQKDPPVSQFNLTSLNDFQYESELDKLEKVAPTLMACIGGTISASKDQPLVNLTRKGFGGSRQSEEISLVPTMVQTATCILRNRHPNSISTIPCVNSLNNWMNHVTHQYFFLTNSLGQSFRIICEMAESRTVRFGRKAVSGPAGLLVDHWAIQVGEGWWEVAGPEDNDGHIRGRAGVVNLSGGLSVSSDIVAEYDITHSTGDTAASGVVPSMVVGMTFAGIFWWFEISVMVIMLLGWIRSVWNYGLGPMTIWGWWSLGDELLVLLLVTLYMLLPPLLSSWAVMKMLPEQYGVLVYKAIFIVWCLYCTVPGLYVIIARAAAWKEQAPLASILFIIYCFTCTVCVDQLCELGYNCWCGEYSDPSLGSILGWTRRTNHQIEHFNNDFKRKHPQYKGLTENCQFYAREFLSFLMEEGERKRNLPGQESPLTADTLRAGLGVGLGSLGIVVVTVFISYLYTKHYVNLERY